MDRNLDDLLRDGVREFLESAQEDAQTVRCREIAKRVQGKDKMMLRLARNVDSHPFWWALPHRDNPRLRLVRDAA